MPRLPLILLLSVVFQISAYADELQPRVGVITALTGGMATIGSAVRNGIELARADRPEVFVGVSFSYEDDQFDAKQSLGAYRSLRSNNNPDVLLGFGTVLAQVVGPLVERDRIPFINFNFEAAPVAGRKFIVRAMNHTDQYMDAMASNLKRDGAPLLPVVQTEATFFRAMIGSLRQGLGTEGSILEIATVSPSDRDFRAVITKLRPYNGTRVGIFLWPEQIIHFLRQARELHFHAEYFGTDLCETAATLSDLGNLVEGCIYPDNEASAEFRKRYRERFGNEAQLTFAGAAYDSTMIIGDILRKNPTLRSDALMEKLAEVRDYPGVLGSVSYRHEERIGKYFHYPVHVKKIIKGRGVGIQ